MTDLPPVPRTGDEARQIALDDRWPLEVRQEAWRLYRRSRRQRRPDEPPRILTNERKR